MDIKKSLAAYPALVGNLVSEKNIQESIALLLQGSVPYEFRATLIKEIHTTEIIDAMVHLVSGAARMCLQTFRPGHTLCAKFENYHAFSVAEFAAIKNKFAPHVKEIIMR